MLLWQRMQPLEISKLSNDTQFRGYRGVVSVQREVGSRTSLQCPQEASECVLCVLLKCPSAVSVSENRHLKTLPGPKVASNVHSEVELSFSRP